MKKALVVISFGTSYKEARVASIEACENTIRERFPEMDFYRSWTSKMVIKKVRERDNEVVLYPSELLEKLYRDGYKEVYIQSLHIVCGEEYQKMMDIIDRYRDKFEKIVVGRPLLYTIEDYDEIAEFMVKVSNHDKSEDFNNEHSATVWMGHGTSNVCHASYAGLGYRFRKEDASSYIGTVEGYPTIDDVVTYLKKDEIKTVHLRPFLLVAGDHARNDMASDEPDSWRNILLKNGFNVLIHMDGIGEFRWIKEKFAIHLEEAIEEDRKKLKITKNKKHDEKKGKFFGIGVGPGDSDLLTIKAVNTIDSLDVLFVPYGNESKESTAKQIVLKHIRENLKVEERHFPMTYNEDEKVKAWNSIAEEIEGLVNEGKEVGFVTLGDPMVYSTYVYLLERLINKIEVETIPGINSFINISSSNNFPLAMDKESLAVISCTDNMDRISRVIDDFESIVLMKVYRNFKDIIALIESKKLDDKFIMVSNSSMEDEKIYRNVDEIKALDKVPYFTTILINKKW